MFIIKFQLFKLKIKPINSESLNAWMNQTQLQVDDLRFLDRMLRVFNYPLSVNEARSQRYEMDDLVVKNNENVQMNKKAYEEMAEKISDHFVGLKKPKPHTF